MNSVSEGGLALAKEIASAYTGSPGVKVIMVGGSVSRGCADAYSDLEIGILWADAPSGTERKAAIEFVGGELWSFERSPEHEIFGLSGAAIGTDRYQGTAMISTQHLTCTDLETCLVDVQERYDTSLGKQMLLAAVQNAVPLFGAGLLREWKTRAAVYPKELAIKMIQENLWFGPWFCPEAYAGRDDRLVLYQHFIWIEQGMLKVLAGLNRLYYPSPEDKWMDEFAAKMTFAPLNLSRRMKQVFQVDPLEGWQIMKELIDETIALIEIHMPEVDTISMFKEKPEVNTTWAKARWTTHPPYTLMQKIGAASERSAQ